MPTTVSALARSSHPGPTLAVTAVAAILAVGTGLEPWRVAVITAVVLTNQVSVGLSNDWLDAARDRKVGRSDKPIATGELPERTARSVALASAGLSLVLSLLLGWPTAVAAAVFLAAGWSYNLGLKATVLSVVPYVVGFGALPLVVTLSRPEPAPAAWWVIVAGALLGTAAHFANAIPDLEDDRATGIRGLPSVVGVRGSGIIVATALATASLLLVLGPGAPHPLRVVGLALSLVLAAGCAGLVLIRPASRAAFALTIASALLAVVLLVSSGSRIVA